MVYEGIQLHNGVRTELPTSSVATAPLVLFLLQVRITDGYFSFHNHFTEYRLHVLAGSYSDSTCRSFKVNYSMSVWYLHACGHSYIIQHDLTCLLHGWSSVVFEETQVVYSSIM